MQNIKFFFVSILFVSISFALSATELSGFVRDSQTGEILIGANVWDKLTNGGTSTDTRGYFNLKVTTPCTVIVSYIGYKTQELHLTSPKDSVIIVTLFADNSLAEVTVRAVRERAYEVSRISAKELMQVPSIGGKPDVIKALQLLPGVLSLSEGMSLMMVRGGEPGQNQYLLDNVPLTYVNHLGGLMSVFNPDMINSVDFYKGNFPARYGGKLSSIVDITQREGDVSKHQGSFSIGVTDASFTFEGPLANKKMSYIVTARKTLIDALMAGISTAIAENSAIVAYGFHDINAKLTWKPNERDNLSFNLYQGDDYLNYWTKPWKMQNNESSHIYQQWGNWLASIRWNRLLNTKLYAENIISFSRYRNKSGQDYSYKDVDVTNQIETLNRASVNDLSFRTKWKYSLSNRWKLEFGGQTGYLLFEPSYNYLSTSTTPIISTKFNAIESAVYLDNKIKLAPRFLFQPSLRITNFINNGECFTELEPRVNLSYEFSDNHSINLNYMSVSQNSHLVFAQTELLKREVWLPATSKLRPEISNQFSASWNGRFASGKFSAETNIYYKKMEHLVSLKEGYENMKDITAVENKIESGGKGNAFGVELVIKKNTGKWTGMMSYAWSHSDRRFLNINEGKSYEFDFNRPHSFTINANRKFPKNWDFSAVWIFQSGIPYTPALGKYYTLDPNTGKNIVEIIYGAKNSDRMQVYHRLDIGFNHTVTTRHGNKAVWTYSIYNAYCHTNPYSYYFDNDNDIENQTDNKKPLQLYKMGIFPIIPSISYKLYFDYSKKQRQVEKINKQHKRFNWLYY